MKLETNRLILREFEEKDLEDLVENLNNVKIAQYFVAMPHPYTREDAKKWIEYCKEIKETKKNYEFAMELKENNKLIGGLNLSKFDYFREIAEIAYWLDENFWRQGFTKEAIKRVLAFGFEDLDLRRIESRPSSDNEASNKLMEKLGFELEGVKRSAFRIKSTNKIHDMKIWGLLKSDYTNLK